MDELQAKKILDALAKKMCCDSVYIYSSYSLDGIPLYSIHLELKMNQSSDAFDLTKVYLFDIIKL